MTEAKPAIFHDLSATENLETPRLSNSEERFRLVLEASPDGFIILRSVRDAAGEIVDFQIEYTNLVAPKGLNRTPEELLNQSLLQLFPDAQTSGIFARYVTVAKTGISTTFETFYESKNLTGWFRNVVVKLNNGIVVSFSDITARKQAEQRQQVQYSITQILAQAKTVAEAIPVILQALCENLGWQVGALWQIEANSHTLRCFNYWQAANLDMQAFGEATQQITFAQGIGLPGRVWSSRQPQWISELSKDSNFPRTAIASGVGLQSGFGFPILLGDEILGVIECFSDRIQAPDADLLEMMQAIGSQIGQFMERKRTEAALQESQQLFQSFMNHSPIAAFIKDESGRYLYVNSRVEQVCGRPQSDLIGKTDFELLPASIAQQFYTNDIAVLTSGQPMQILETVQHEDGEHSYMSFKFPFRNAAGQKLLAGVSLDVTEQQAALRDRIQAEEELRQKEVELRLLTNTLPVLISFVDAEQRYRDEFLAVLSHELRSPLNPILGWSRLLQTAKLDEARTKQALATIERNAKLQAELIEDLLDVSRILQGKLSLTSSPVNLASIITAAIETVRLAAEAKSIQIEANLDTEIKLVLGDSTRLQQVLWNLLSNAVKFTPPGGRVEVRLFEVDNQAQIMVCDTGKGISPNFLPYVFDYFRQADSTTTRKFGGLGLGLAIVRHLVELHGGTIQADSMGEGMGATFTLKLPLMPTQPSVNQDSPSSELSLSLDNIEILVVDDDTDTRDFVAFLLEQAGAKVITAACAAEALEILTQSQPDVLLSDIGMPQVNGYMLMQQIRALPPEQGGQIPAIALTAYAGEIDEKQALKVGFQKHISKPADPDNLVRTIVNLIGESR